MHDGSQRVNRIAQKMKTLMPEGLRPDRKKQNTRVILYFQPLFSLFYGLMISNTGDETNTEDRTKVKDEKGLSTL